MTTAFRKSTLTPRGRQRGQALVDYSLYIVIAVLVLIGLVALYLTNRSNTTASNETQSLISTTANIQKLYANDTNGFTNISVTNLVANNVIPSGQVTAGAWILPVGGTVAVASANLFGSTGDSFSLTIPGVPANDCSNFTQALASNYPYITVNGTTIEDSTTGVAFSPAALGPACGTTGNATIVLEAGRG
jgi:Tfp pilus assembly protein PilW